MGTEAETGILAEARARRLVRDAPALARSLRLDSSLTLAEVGRALGVSHACIHRWETGQRVPRGDMAVRYLALLRKAAAS